MPLLPDSIRLLGDTTDIAADLIEAVREQGFEGTSPTAR